MKRNETKLHIKVKTISKKHVDQLPYQHFWNGEFKWEEVQILGRMANNGFILVRRKSSGELEKIAPIAFIDDAFAKAGGKVNGVYAPTPHTKYSLAAQAAYANIPLLFVE